MRMSDRSRARQWPSSTRPRHPRPAKTDKGRMWGGVHNFPVSYVRNWRSVENPAYDRQRYYPIWWAQHSGQVGPQPTTSNTQGVACNGFNGSSIFIVPAGWNGCMAGISLRSDLHRATKPDDSKSRRVGSSNSTLPIGCESEPHGRGPFRLFGRRKVLRGAPPGQL